MRTRLVDYKSLDSKEMLLANLYKIIQVRIKMKLSCSIIKLELVFDPEVFLKNRGNLSIIKKTELNRISRLKERQGSEMVYLPMKRGSG